MPDLDILNNTNRNATASWSGYLHQGKVGIFVALKKINELLNGNENQHSDELFNGWSVEYETAEDFDIKNVEGVDSRHQVKAKKNITTKGGYNDVLNPDRFDINGVPEDSRFLHTIRGITDWDTSPQVNPNVIQLYEYPDGNMHCSTYSENGDLENFCITEIEKINDNGSQIVFEHLLFQLDQKIRLEHANKAQQDYAPMLTFQEIYEIITEINPLAIHEDMRLRKEFSESWEKYKFDLDDRQEVLNGKETNIDEFVEKIYESRDTFCNFLRILQPNKRGLSINESGLRNVFFKSLLKINEEFNDIKIGYSKNGKRYILTTINNDQDDAPNLAKDIIENSYIENSKLFFEGNYLINKEIDEKFPDTIMSLISYSKERNDEGFINWDKELDDENIFFNPTETEFLSLEKIRNNNILDNNL